MKSVTVCIKVDEKQESHLLPLVDRHGEYFVANPHATPHADKHHHSVLVRLDPKRLVEAPDASFPLNYTGTLIEIRTVPDP
jgi:hypothetical protein